MEAYAVWPKENGHSLQKRYPALLLLHGADARAHRFRRVMLDHVQDNLFIMSISLPGFGASTGPEDFAGPRSVDAVLGAIHFLKTRGNVRKDGIFIYGIGQGATAAVLAAAKSKIISGLILENGFYELEKTYTLVSRKMKNKISAVLGEAPGSKKGAYRERSPALQADKIRTPILLLHSQDAPYPIRSAKDFLKTLRDNGGTAELEIIKTQGPFESLTHPNIAKWVIPFIRKAHDTR